MPQKSTVLHKIRVDNCQWWGNMALIPVKLDGGGSTCLQSSDSEASSKVGISVGILLMVMVDEGWGDSRPIKSNCHVIMLMVVIPHMSWTILLTTTVDPISWGRACSSISRGWDIWLLLRVLAIFVNPGGGVCGGALVFSSGASTLGLNVAIHVVTSAPAYQGCQLVSSPIGWRYLAHQSSGWNQLGCLLWRGQ